LVNLRRARWTGLIQIAAYGAAQGWKDPKPVDRDNAVAWRPDFRRLTFVCTKAVQIRDRLPGKERPVGLEGLPLGGKFTYRWRMKQLQALTPVTIRKPFAAYAQGTHVPAGAEWVFTSGQLGITPDDTIPEGARAQAELCFAACAAVLAEAGFDKADTVRINAFVTDRAHMAGYMQARDAWCAGLARLPASTLVIVSGFTRPEFVVEVEVTAARLPPG
jgi:enamine deaminase RidA (YjgF/YER057c/UK114 family)